MKPDNNSTGRYRFLFIIICLAACYILGTALQTMLSPQKDYWVSVGKRFTKENLPIPANRGNLLASDGQLLAGSIPEFRLYMDYVIIDADSVARVKAQHWRDSAFKHDLDSIATGLAKIFPDKSKKWFRDKLEEGKKRKSHAWRIYPKNATYIQLQECKKLPLLRETSLKGGFYTEEIIQRKKPFGSLASRTIGDLWSDSNGAKCGLELSFDSILRGKPGIGHSTKVRNRRIRFIDREPQNGHDLVTTIDVNIQDVAEKAMRKMLTSLDGTDIGIAMVMEVATGDIKAIVNLKRSDDGKFYEDKNYAISDLMEPGSTFKTASIMVGLEDGKIKKNETVDCTGGTYPMHGRTMRDHNWRKGGYGTLTVSEILEQSSNIGVSRLIDRAYHNSPQKFVDGLKDLGVGVPLNLPFVGKGEPVIPQPNSKKRFWSKTDLAWMSIGYVTLLTPIHTLTFYNGIANNGRMVKPRFVKAEKDNGIVVREFPTEVIREKMCSQHTLDDIHDILEKVVSKGLGKRAGNGGKLFKVSGKTGTAQMAQEGGKGYHSGIPQYMVSFCGYYPSEAPKYSTIVCIVKKGLPASGGLHCGPVFSEISQYVMSKGVLRDPKDAADSTSVFTADIAPGNEEGARLLVEHLNLNEKNALPEVSDSVKANEVPNVVGMGAKSAIHALRAKKINVKVKGTGKVVSQSMAAGSTFKAGQTISLKLE
ncbi:MAG: transpeptidase family protein [Bacteroidaceae bacterium]|nr:transpeptidase family protein [Bacteroidaceae bacterium]